MSASHWERVQEILEGALELPAAEQRAFVSSQCDGDVALRDEVLSLLDVDAVDDLPSRWLGALASPDTDRFAVDELVGGRYRIRALIGRGGMGEVYEAFDEELGITVALKALREVGSSATELE